MAEKTFTRKKPEKVKEECLSLLKESNTVKEQEFNIQNIIDQRVATDIIKRYEENMKTIIYRAIQGQMLKILKNMEVLSRTIVYLCFMLSIFIIYYHYKTFIICY